MVAGCTTVWLTPAAGYCGHGSLLISPPGSSRAAHVGMPGGDRGRGLSAFEANRRMLGRVAKGLRRLRMTTDFASEEREGAKEENEGAKGARQYEDNDLYDREWVTPLWMITQVCLAGFAPPCDTIVPYAAHHSCRANPVLYSHTHGIYGIPWHGIESNTNSVLRVVYGRTAGTGPEQSGQVSAGTTHSHNRQSRPRACTVLFAHSDRGSS